MMDASNSNLPPQKLQIAYYSLAGLHIATAVAVLYSILPATGTGAVPAFVPYVLDLSVIIALCFLIYGRNAVRARRPAPEPWVSQELEREISVRRKMQADFFAQMTAINRSQAVAQFDMDGILLTANDIFLKMMGYALEEVLGKHHSFFAEPAERTSPSYHKFWQDLKTGKPQIAEARRLGKAAKEVWTQATYTPILDQNDRPFKIIEYAADISERKRLDKMKDEFVSMVSHELRTPLTSIRGSLGLIEGGLVGEISEEAMPLIKIANNNCERLVRLINDILDIEKIESGKIDFHMQTLSLSTLIANCLEANRSYAGQYEVRLAFEAPGFDTRVYGDPDRLAQVVTNLLSNAVKYSPQGGIVTLGIERRDYCLRVSVSDAGEGIAPDFRPRVFQKFAQADCSNTRQKGGNGLGLSIAKAMVEKHGGEINFETETGKGTTFYFDLPQYAGPVAFVQA